jgi:N utilization substance protein B
MPSRHRSRKRALQVLFQADIRHQEPGAAVRTFYDSLAFAEEDDQPAVTDPFMEELVAGTIRARDEIDQRISSHSEHWRLDRMAVVDRNILRLAVYEMTTVGTPPPVVIDEALELARRFSSEESGAFINGVLDAVRRGLSSDTPLLADAEGGEDPVEDVIGGGGAGDAV